MVNNFKSEKLKIKGIQTDRIRYFNTLQNASTTAALRFVTQRQNMIEELMNEKSNLKISNYFFDAIMGLAVGPLAGTLLKKFTMKLIDSVVGLRFKALGIEQLSGQLKFSLIENKKGNLITFEGFVENKGYIVMKKVVKNNWNERAALMWKASSNAMSDTVKKIGEDKLKELFNDKTAKSITSGSTNPVDIAQALFAATESQKTFEIKLFDYILTNIDPTEHSESFIKALIELVISKPSLREQEMTSMHNQFILHFELCMWVVYLEDLDRLVRGSISYIDKIMRADETNKSTTNPGRRGNSLLIGKDGGTADFGDVKIKRPKLVDYLVKEMIHPNSKNGKTIFEYFIELKGRRQRINPNLIKAHRNLLGQSFLSLDSRPHLYKEMVYTELMPVLKKYQTEAKKILGNKA